MNRRTFLSAIAAITTMPATACAFDGLQFSDGSVLYLEEGHIEVNGVRVFSHSELACKKTGIVKLAPGFAEKLGGLRFMYDREMAVNSCCRSQMHNAEIGGHPRSLHVYDYPYHPTNGCMAIDIAVSGPDKADLFGLAWGMGWSIGFGNGFLHLDRRVDIRSEAYPNGMRQTVFDYYSGNEFHQTKEA